MIFSDKGILDLLNANRLSIDPFSKQNLSPGSICLTLDREVRVFDGGSKGTVDPFDRRTYPVARKISIDSEGSYEIEPGQFLLGATRERIGLHRSIGGRISNISGLARLGLSVEFCDHIAPGFGEEECRRITLEIFNLSRNSILLRRRMKICHLIILETDGQTQFGYDSQFPGKYRHQRPGASEYS